MIVLRSTYTLYILVLFQKKALQNKINVYFKSLSVSFSIRDFIMRETNIAAFCANLHSFYATQNN